jgi:hypothetical protein
LTGWAVHRMELRANRAHVVIFTLPEYLFAARLDDQMMPGRSMHNWNRATTHQHICQLCHGCSKPAVLPYVQLRSKAPLDNRQGGKEPLRSIQRTARLLCCHRVVPCMLACHVLQLSRTAYGLRARRVCLVHCTTDTGLRRCRCSTATHHARKGGLMTKRQVQGNNTTLLEFARRCTANPCFLQAGYQCHLTGRAPFGQGETLRTLQPARRPQFSGF